MEYSFLNFRQRKSTLINVWQKFTFMPVEYNPNSEIIEPQHRLVKGELYLLSYQSISP